MRNIYSFFLVLGISLLFSCSAPKEAPQRIVNTTESSAKDSVEYYATDFEIIQKNYLDQLVGKWNVQTMQRQQRLPEETLSGTTITFNRDMSFEANTSCGRLIGSYTMKGTSIVFVNPIKEWTNCDKAEVVSKMIDLMANTVSAYTVNSSELLLRDGSSNIVFKATK